MYIYTMKSLVVLLLFIIKDEQNKVQALDE